MKQIAVGFLIACVFACGAPPMNGQEATPVKVDEKPKGNPADTEDWVTKPQQISFEDNIPSDAIRLFDGGSLVAWDGKGGKAPKWTVSEGVMMVKPGSGGIKTKDKFCDAQYHLEWRSPAKGKKSGKGQQWGNSGVFIQGRYEVQILNSYQNETYSNGQAASVYKQHPPLVNASIPVGGWQTYDIIFTAPKFEDNGDLKSPGYVTVLHNGVLVQNHSELAGHTAFIGKPKYKPHGCSPLMLQDHGEPVEFRNVWARKLN